MKKIFTYIDNVVKRINIVSLWVSMLILLTITLLIFIDVIFRYLLNSPIQGQQELAELAIVIVVYFGLPYAIRFRKQVRVEALTLMLPDKVKAFLYGILNLIIVAFLSSLTYKIFIQAQNLNSINGSATLVLRIPHYPFYYATAFGAALSTLEFFIDGIRYFIEAIKGIDNQSILNSKEGAL